MRRMFNLLLTLLTIYLGTRLLLGLISKGHNIVYNIDKYEIIEQYTHNNKEEKNNYYIEIKDNSTNYNFKIYKNLLNREKIVKEIEKYAGNSYSCIKVKFYINEEIDIICNKNNILYNYSTIKGQDKILDQKIQKTDYDITKYIGTNDIYRKDFVKIYKNNLIKNKNMVILNYRGFYFVSDNMVNKIKDNNLYQNDIYKKKAFSYKNYIILADYNQKNDFNTFQIINIKNGATYKIEGEYDISFDIFYQGGIKNSIYLIDTYNKKQYQVNLKTKEIILLGNNQIGAKIYINGKWQTQNLSEVIKEKYLFNNKFQYSYNNTEYPLVFNVGEEKGYSIVFQKNGNNYDAYMIEHQNPNIKTYIFKTSSLNNLFFDNEYIYYVYGNTLYVHNRSKGNKKILESSELIDNNNLFYAVYKNTL